MLSLLIRNLYIKHGYTQERLIVYSLSNAFCILLSKATGGNGSGNNSNTNATVAPDTDIKSNGHVKPDDMTSKDYYFDSYAHFGIHEVRIAWNVIE